MQSLLRAIYPAQCIGCGEVVQSDGLCGPCWRETWFITGHACDACGAPLPGESDGHDDLCDACMATPRPWRKGRSALVYKGTARRMILGLKHADRLDMVPPMAGFMLRAVRPVLAPGMVVVPVPSHWWRHMRRRYNPAAELARALARQAGLVVAPDVLVRTRAGETQEGKSAPARFANVEGMFRPHPKKAARIAQKNVLLVDDVMASGATLAACTRALLDAGAGEIRVLTLARVVRDT